MLYNGMAKPGTRGPLSNGALFRAACKGRAYAMTTQPKFKSTAFEAIHSAASGMLRAGTIDKTTMRRFDISCLAVPNCQGAQ